MNDTIHAFNEPFHVFFFNLKRGPVSQTPSTPMEKTTVGIALRVDSDLLKTNEDILAFQKKKKQWKCLFTCPTSKQADVCS